ASASRGAALPADAEELRAAELERVEAKMRAGFAAKQEEVRALLAGRSTPKQALARLRKFSTLRPVDGGALSEEAGWESVLVHASYYLLREKNADASAALAPLLRQVREHLAQRQGSGR